MYVRYNERRMFEDFSTLIDTGFRYLVEIISLAFVSWYQTRAESPKTFHFFFSRFGNSSFRCYSISQTPGWEMRVVGNETLKTEISVRSNYIHTYFIGSSPLGFSESIIIIQYQLLPQPCQQWPKVIKDWKDCGKLLKKPFKVWCGRIWATS